MKIKVNELFDAEVASVENAFPSIYNKDNVITLLNNLKAKINEIDDTSITTDLLNKLKDEVLSTIDNYDYDSEVEIDLSYDGRRLDVNFNTGGLTREIESTFDEFEVL